MSEEEAAAFEAEKGVRLPEDYRRFITTIATSGSQPCKEYFRFSETIKLPKAPDDPNIMGRKMRWIK